MDSKSFLRIERLNYLFGAILFAVAAVLASQEQALGVLAGVVLTCANFSLIRRLVSRLLAAPPERRGITAFYFVPKMAGLMVAVALVIFFLPVSPVGLAVGFSVFLVSIAVESIRFVTRQTLTH